MSFKEFLFRIKKPVSDRFKWIFYVSGVLSVSLNSIFAATYFNFFPEPVKNFFIGLAAFFTGVSIIARITLNDNDYKELQERIKQNQL